MKMKILTSIAPVLAVSLLAGCATAGSTIARVNEQSYEIQRELDKEQEITRNYEAEKRRLDSQIAALKSRERQLSQSSAPAAPIELIKVRNAIQKYEQQRSNLIETARIAKNIRL